MKKSTASKAIIPGKKRYIASLNPIASLVCSIRMPIVPENIVIHIKFQNYNRLTSNDVHDKDEECRADGSGVGWDNLHNDSEQDGKPGLSK